MAILSKKSSLNKHGLSVTSVYIHFLSWYKNGKCYNRKNTEQYKKMFTISDNQI